MDHLIVKMSQKSQIKYLKVSVMLREKEHISEEQIPDIQIYHAFIHNNKDIKLTIDHLKQIVAWKKDNQKLLKEAQNLDVVSTEQKMIEMDCLSVYYGLSKNNCPVFYNTL